MSGDQTVVLNGSSSNDGTGIESYLWSQTSGTPVALSAKDTAVAEFTAPEVQKDSEVLIFELTVQCINGLTDSDLVAVMVENKSSSDSTCFISTMH